MMKSSSSEESVQRKRAHSQGACSLTPSLLSTMTTTNICDINIDTPEDVPVLKEKIVVVSKAVNGEYLNQYCFVILLNIFSTDDINSILNEPIVQQQPKYNYHDEPHSFENSMDYLVVGSNNNSTILSETPDLDSSVATTNDEIIYTNSHFKFEVLETTV